MMKVGRENVHVFLLMIYKETYLSISHSFFVFSPQRQQADRSCPCNDWRFFQFIVLCIKCILHDKLQVLRSFCQPAHEIPKPVIAKRNIRAEVISFICKRLLHFRSESIEHLKFKAVLWHVIFMDECLQLINNMVVMGGDGCEGIAE